jgi:hypothetical protein
MALALILNLILCVGIVVAIVGHLAWGIRASRVDERALAGDAVRRRSRVRPVPARRGRLGDPIRPTA